MSKHRYADIMPPLASDELAALRSAIKSDGGVLVPIITDEDGEIIDGKHRHAIDPNCPRKVLAGSKRMTDAQKKAAAIRLNVARRNLTGEQKAELEKHQHAIADELAAEVDHKGETRWSQAEIGGMLGVARTTIEGWLKIISVDDSVIANNSDNAEPSEEPAVPPKQKRKKKRQKLDRADENDIWQRCKDSDIQSQVAADYGISQGRVAQVVKKIAKIKDAEQQAEEDAAEAEQRHAEAASKIVVVGDFREVGVVVEDGSVDLIFTDPPYDAETIPQYGRLAEFAARVLIPGGSLICYVGHYAVGEVIKLMNDHLRYWWLNAVIHTGGNKAFPGKFVQVGWKPLLWYVKGHRANKTLVRDCITSAPGDKDTHHPWAQGEIEATYYIEHLSRKKSLVVDPYCGGGTTGVAAMKAGRRFKGFEIDAKAARKAEGRILSQ